MSNLPSWYDSWKTHDPASEEAEQDICETCGELMEWVDDVDVDEETGKAYLCGGNWHCPNKNCGQEQKPSEEENKGA